MSAGYNSFHGEGPSWIDSRLYSSQCTIGIKVVKRHKAAVKLVSFSSGLTAF
ncbi:Uncharacterized protein APZ42_026893 [Daphnia magna]|uniref:Uncharacterized protein n=1 Tax=Daphnia magna TaxID=35525 RepID=A0A164RW03_9CRUS|nr:Uncharacterized protein APZ42_026893 [Daphnia magna]